MVYARRRVDAAGAVFYHGDSMALPFDPDRFDVAVMALVLFFVPDPARGIAEMMRVVQPGGLISAYVWDIPGGGLPIEPVHSALRQAGIERPDPPSATVSAMPALRAAFTHAGLCQVETHSIIAERTFSDFEAYWTAALMVGGLGDIMAKLSADTVEAVRALTRARLRVDTAGAVVAIGTANAIKGTVPT